MRDDFFETPLPRIEALPPPAWAEQSPQHSQKSWGEDLIGAAELLVMGMAKNIGRSLAASCLFFGLLTAVSLRVADNSAHLDQWRHHALNTATATGTGAAATASLLLFRYWGRR